MADKSGMYVMYVSLGKDMIVMENLLQIGKEIKVILALGIFGPGNLNLSLSQIEFVYGIGFVHNKS